MNVENVENGGGVSSRVYRLVRVYFEESSTAAAWRGPCACVSCIHAAVTGLAGSANAAVVHWGIVF